MRFLCVACGAVYPANTRDEWGRGHKDSSGLGPRPVCTQVVEDPYAPKAANGETPLRVCRGDLIADAGADPGAFPSKYDSTNKARQARGAPAIQA